MTTLGAAQLAAAQHLNGHVVIAAGGDLADAKTPGRAEQVGTLTTRPPLLTAPAAPKRQRVQPLRPFMSALDSVATPGLLRTDTTCVHCLATCGGVCHTMGPCGFLYCLTDSYEQTNTAMVYIQKTGLTSVRGLQSVKDLGFQDWGLPVYDLGNSWSVQEILPCIAKVALNHSLKHRCSWAVVSVQQEGQADDVSPTEEKWDNFLEGIQQRQL